MKEKLNTIKIQRITQEYCGKLYATTFNNLEEMGKFLEVYNLPKLNNEEVEILHRLITSKELKQ